MFPDLLGRWLHACFRLCFDPCRSDRGPKLTKSIDQNMHTCSTKNRAQNTSAKTQCPKFIFPLIVPPYPAQITAKYAWPTSKRTGKQIQTDARTQVALLTAALAIRKSSPMESDEIFTMDSAAHRKDPVEALIEDDDGGLATYEQLPSIFNLCFATEIMISAAASGAWSWGR
jgi:hypothetical protein